MPTNYPGALDAFVNPAAAGGDTLDNPPHDVQHANANDAVEAIETELGVNPRGTHATVRARLDKADLWRPQLHTVQDGANPPGYTVRTADKTLTVPDPGAEVDVVATATITWRFTSNNGNASFELSIGGTLQSEPLPQASKATFDEHVTTITFSRKAFTPTAPFDVVLWVTPSIGTVARNYIHLSAQLFPTGA